MTHWTEELERLANYARLGVNAQASAEYVYAATPARILALLRVVKTEDLNDTVWCHPEYIAARRALEETS